jgi:putative MATE family efflux protein
MNQDLTSGKPESVLWRFCLPLFGSVIFQQLYSITDSLVAGNFIGETALASVGNSYEVTLLFITFALGCNIGCSVIAAQFFGAKEYSKLKTTISTACIASAVLCGILMCIGAVSCGELLHLIHTPEEAFADSKLYLGIYIWGLPFIFFYNIANGIFTALGDSRTPFIFLVFSSIANIGVDILFVTRFKMGVAGVAWATFLCQGISCLLAVTVVFLRLKKIKTPKNTGLFSFEILQKIAVIAIPSILQQGFISVGNIVIQGIVNGFGTGVMAGYSAGVKLNDLVTTAFTTLGNGISNYTAQNLGAQKLLRIKNGFRAGIKLVWILSLPLFLLYFFGGRYVLHLFMDQPTDVAIQTGVAFLRIVSPFYFVISAKLVADGVLRGAGMMGKFMIATLADLTLRVVLATVLSKTVLGATGIWCAWPVGWSLAAVLTVSFYHTGPWKNVSQQ